MFVGPDLYFHDVRKEKIVLSEKQCDGGFAVMLLNSMIAIVNLYQFQKLTSEFIKGFPENYIKNASCDSCQFFVLWETISW